MVIYIMIHAQEEWAGSFLDLATGLLLRTVGSRLRAAYHNDKNNNKCSKQTGAPQ